MNQLKKEGNLMLNSPDGSRSSRKGGSVKERIRRKFLNKPVIITPRTRSTKKLIGSLGLNGGEPLRGIVRNVPPRGKDERLMFEIEFGPPWKRVRSHFARKDFTVPKKRQRKCRPKRQPLIAP